MTAALTPEDLEKLDIDTLRALLVQKDQTIARLTHEIAVLRRFRFGRKAEHLNSVQGQLFEEEIDTDIAAIEAELHQLARPSAAAQPRTTPKRQALPASLPRIDLHHEPDSTTCRCGCPLQRIGQDVSEKLDYLPGVARVERHIRGKWACRHCGTLTQAPVPARVIDKGLPTAGMLAHVLVSKYADHLPLYRQKGIMERAGISLPVSTLADWVGQCGISLQPLVDALREEVLACQVLHADETPIQVLKPETGAQKTHRAWLWAYAPASTQALKAVVYDFVPSRSGEHARTFLSGWQGHLVVDDYAGYKKTVSEQGVTEVACWAHARRKFFELHAAHGSLLAEEALQWIGRLYEVEREAKSSDPESRWQLRQQRSRPILERLHSWMLLQQQKVPNGSGTAKALDYSLKRWVALTRYLDDGRLPIDNNLIEQQIRPIAVGKKNWLFAGSLRAGQRAAAIMTLIQSARLNGHDPHAYLKDVLTRLPTHPNRQIRELLPHQWQPTTA